MSRNRRTGVTAAVIARSVARSNPVFPSQPRHAATFLDCLVRDDAVDSSHNNGSLRNVKQPCVYIVANGRNGTLYTGVTANLIRRAFEHREGLLKGFTTKYGCKLLVWYERHETMLDAIAREKQIKAGSRAKKVALIEDINPNWTDLYDSLM